MKNIRKIDGEIDHTVQSCITCAHCYIVPDSLIKVSEASKPLLFCNFDKNKPRSGCVLSEPFNYYEKDVYDSQEAQWKNWADLKAVDVDNVCDNYAPYKK